VRLSREPIAEDPDPPEEAMAMKEKLEQGQDRESNGHPSGFTCPECGGTLWETEAGGTVSYRCRVGHAYTLHNLLVRHGETVERALWTAYRALEERAAMSRRVSRRLADRGRLESAERFERQAEISADHAAELKTILDHLDTGALEAEETEAQAAG
jgi:two-component system chemotaxis response regulator CheB